MDGSLQVAARSSAASWLTRERTLALALMAATVLTLVVCYLLVRPFLPALAWALALAIVASPFHRAICTRLPWPGIAAALTVAAVVVVLVMPALFVSHHLVRQASAAVRFVTEELESGRLRHVLEEDPRLAPLGQWVGELVDSGDLVHRAEEGLQSKAGSVVTGTVWTLVQLFVTVFTLFYFLRDRGAIVASLHALVPLSKPESDLVASRVVDTIRATVFGSLTVAAVQGTLGGLMFWTLGLPTPLLWGAVMTVLAMVPTLGTFVIWLPAAIFLAVQGAWIKALILAVWGGVAISLIDNLLYPTLVGGRLRLHTLPVFLAVLGGLVVFGAAGLILGPVTLAVSLALTDIWRWRTSHGRPAEVPLGETSPAGSASA